MTFFLSKTSDLYRHFTKLKELFTSEPPLVNNTQTTEISLCLSTHFRFEFRRWSSSSLLHREWNFGDIRRSISICSFCNE